MIFQGKDGELRIMDFGYNGTSSMMKVLFCEMDFDGPTSRPRTEEEMIMDRGNFDTNTHYIEKDDMPRYAPIPITFSCRLADTVNTRKLADWLSGATKNLAGGTTPQLYSFKGKTTIDGNTLPDFVNNTAKYAYRVEVLWDGTNDLGYKYEEVYFTPGEQKITESADNTMLSVNGQVFGDVTRITAFTSGFTQI